MKTNLKKIIIVIVVLVVAFIAYQYFFTGSKASSSNQALTSSKSSTTTTVKANTATPQTKVDKDTAFLSTLLSISKIKVDGTIFSSPSFSSLQDNNVPVTNEEVVGRTNPFAPLDGGKAEVLTIDPVITIPASLITSSSATLSGSIASDIKAQSRSFELGKSETVLDQEVIVKDQSLVGTFTKNITGLSPKTTYYYRAVIKVGANKINGSVMSFTTN